MSFSFYLDNLKRFDANTQKFMGKRYRAKAMLSELYCAIRYGCSPDDYFRYEFYKKSSYERNRFITFRRSRRLIKKYNSVKSQKYFGDKCLFNQRFSDYIGREWLDMNKCNQAQFTEFVNKHKEVLIKPSGGGQGKGIYKISVADIQSFNIAEYRNYIAEELLKQHSDMAMLNSTSVNTVRVLTFKGEVVACALRIGGDNAIVDNLHSKGVCAHLDREHGIIDGLCIDNAMNKYLFHPKTGKKLVGFQVPNWDKVLFTVRKAAREIPEEAYIGWDVAVLENDVAIIEGNHDPGHDVVQMIAQSGLYEEIRTMETRKKRDDK